MLIIRFQEKLKEKNIIKKDNDAVFSLGFGKRIIINGLVKDFSNIKRNELIEVVDFDPIKNNLLLIGPAEPKIETSLHWMIHHARDDINFIAQIKNIELIKEIKDVEVTDKYPIGSLDNTKEVLKVLRTNKKIIIKNNSLLVVGRNTEDVEKQIQDTFKV